VSQNENENSDYEIEKDETGKECETFGEKWKRIEVGNSEAKNTLGRPTCRREDNMKIYLKDT